MNEPLRRLHKQLGEQILALSSRMSRTSDKAQARELLCQMELLQQRLVAVGRHLLSESTDEIDAHAAEVTRAGKELAGVIKEQDDLKTTVRALTDFLALVDGVLRLVKI